MKVILDYECHPEGHDSCHVNWHRIAEIEVKNYKEAFERAAENDPFAGDELGGMSDCVTIFKKGGKEYYWLFPEERWKPAKYEWNEVILGKDQTLEDYKNKLKNDGSKNNSVEIFEME